MTQFKREKFDSAKKFIFEHGRPLEQALFDFHFENGSVDHIVDEVAKFQNSDGGFGNALEPDLRTPISSGLATSIALREMVEIGVSEKNDILKRTISFLLESLDRKKWRWEIAPKGLRDSPHAPWWADEDIIAAFRGCIANPSAEITGLILNFENLIPKDVLDGLLEKMTSYIREMEQSDGDFQMHDLNCYLSLANSKNLDSSIKKKITPYLIKKAEAIVEKDEEKWGDYCARPLWLCTSPDSAVYPALKKDVERNLDYEIETQNEDGSWSPFWTWGSSFPDVWPKAKAEWSSHLTLNNLIRFKKYGRLEGKSI